MDATSLTAPKRLRAWVHGRVQGVGFRWWVRSQALALGLTGIAKNYPDGRVYVVAEGPAQAVEAFAQRLSCQPAVHGRPGTVEFVQCAYLAPRGLQGFCIR